MSSPQISTTLMEIQPIKSQLKGKSDLTILLLEEQTEQLMKRLLGLRSGHGYVRNAYVCRISSVMLSFGYFSLY